MAKRWIIPGSIIFAIFVLSLLFSWQLHSSLRSSIYSIKVSFSTQGTDFGPKLFTQRYYAFQFHFHPCCVSEASVAANEDPDPRRLYAGLKVFTCEFIKEFSV